MIIRIIIMTNNDHHDHLAVADICRCLHNYNGVLQVTCLIIIIIIIITTIIIIILIIIITIVLIISIVIVAIIGVTMFVLDIKFIF